MNDSGDWLTGAADAVAGEVKDPTMVCSSSAMPGVVVDADKLIVVGAEVLADPVASAADDCPAASSPVPRARRRRGRRCWSGRRGR